MARMKNGIILVGVTLLVCGIGTAYAVQTITATKVSDPPVIDGVADDAVWQKAEPIVTHDKIRQTDVTLKAVYTDTDIFFLVTFKDPDESREHKTLLWNPQEMMYEDGPEREDVFVFKWSMELTPIDLSINADEGYMADIWFWKACRTDPSGFADDKRHILSNYELPDSRRVISKKGNLFYLARPGDEGTEAYEANIFVDHQNDRMPKYTNKQPTGSRADIRAKGQWHDGAWTIEFGRKLDTGNMDDVQFDPAKEYEFGISCYEMAGRSPDQSTTQPLYGTGDVSEELWLEFGK